jgi:hypothetical protein
MMSALGQKQTFGSVRLMSALPPKADIGTQPRYVRLVPKGDIASLLIRTTTVHYIIGVAWSNVRSKRTFGSLGRHFRFTAISVMAACPINVRYPRKRTSFSTINTSVLCIAGNVRNFPLIVAINHPSEHNRTPGRGKRDHLRTDVR